MRWHIKESLRRVSQLVGSMQEREGVAVSSDRAGSR